MPRADFDTLPEDARLWIFAADRPLESEERDRLLERVDAFLEQWRAHGAPLTASRDWRYDRFLFVAVDERAAGVSGCSIDALVNDIKGLEAELNTTMVDYSPVMFREGDAIRRVSRREFAKLAAAGHQAFRSPKRAAAIGGRERTRAGLSRARRRARGAVGNP